MNIVPGVLELPNDREITAYDPEWSFRKLIAIESTLAFSELSPLIGVMSSAHSQTPS